MTRAATISTLYTNRGIPCGEHTYPAIGARSCACDGTCAGRCPVVTALMYIGCDETSHGTNTSLRKLD